MVFRHGFFERLATCDGSELRKMTKKRSYIELVSLEGARFLVCGHTSPVRLCNSQEISSPCHIECSQPEHGIDDVFNDRCESGPFGAVVEMTQPEVLCKGLS